MYSGKLNKIEVIMKDWQDITTSLFCSKIYYTLIKGEWKHCHQAISRVSSTLVLAEWDNH